MKRSISNESIPQAENASKRTKPSHQQSDNPSQISQTSSTTILPDTQPESTIDKSKLNKIYATDSIPDNWDDPLSITHLHLRTDDRYNDETYEGYPFDQFNLFSQLPNLKKISMWGAGGIHIEDAGEYWEIPLRASGVIIMDLRKCQFGTSCLVKVIGFSNGSLEAFTYRTGGLKSPDTGGSIIHPGNVWAVFGESSASLTKLDVDFDECMYKSEYWLERDDYGDDEEDSDSEQDDPSEAVVKKRMEEGGKGPEFPNLTKLRIGIKALMSLMLPQGNEERLVDVLPKELEKLVVRGYDANNAGAALKSQIDEVKEQMGEKLPKLKILEGVETMIENGKDVYDRWNGRDDEEEDSGEYSDGGVFPNSD